jgi:hypothetical protein
MFSWIRNEAAALCILATVIPSAPASAQSIRGTMGPRSQAEVRLTVRVTPRFTLQANSAKRNAGGTDVHPLTLSTNAPDLRYTLATRPAAGGGVNGPVLVLVVPD